MKTLHWSDWTDTPSNGDRALSKAVNKSMDRDPLFLEKCEYHNALMSKFNDTGKCPMELSVTAEGQKQLDDINAKVSKAMVEKYEDMKNSLIIDMLKTFYSNEAEKIPGDREFKCSQIQAMIEILEQEI